MIRLERLKKLAEQCQEVYSSATQEALDGGDVPRYALLTSEGSPESTYRGNPDLTVYDTTGALAEVIAGSLEEGWPPISVQDLDTGEEVSYRVRVTI